MLSSANYDTALHDVKYVISKQDTVIIFAAQCRYMELSERVSIYASITTNLHVATN